MIEKEGRRSISEIPWLHQLIMQSRQGPRRKGVRLARFFSPTTLKWSPRSLLAVWCEKRPYYSLLYSPLTWWSFLKDSNIFFMCQTVGKLSFLVQGKNKWKSIVICVYNVEGNLLNDIERFSIEFPTTKTTVITLANHKRHKQTCEPIKMQLWWGRNARENCASESWLVWVLLAIGWKSGAHFLSQSCSVLV